MSVRRGQTSRGRAVSRVLTTVGARSLLFRSMIAALLMLASLLTLVDRAGAASVTVCNSGPPACDFATIAAAIAAAQPNDTVQIAAGTYVEDNILINKPLKIVGAGEGQTIVSGGSVSRPQGQYYLFNIAIPETGPAGPIEMSQMTLQDPPIAPNSVGTLQAFGVHANMSVATTPVTEINLHNMTIYGGNSLDNRSWSVYFRAQVRNGVAVAAPPAIFDQLTLLKKSRQGILMEDWRAPVTLTNSTIDRALDPVNSYSDFLAQSTLTYRETNPGRYTAPYTISGNTFEGSGIWMSGWYCTKWPDPGDPRQAGWDQVIIDNNRFSGMLNRDSAINLGSSSGCSFNSDAGAQVSKMGSVTITNNVIMGDGSQPDINAIRLTGLMDDVVIQDNSVTGTPRAVHLRADASGYPQSVTVFRNRLIANVLGLFNETPSNVTALDNWWGCQRGPDSGSKWCSAISSTAGGSIDASTWLITTPSLTLLTDLTGTGDATLSLRNDGAAVPLKSDNVFVFDQLPAAWLNSPGTVDPTTGVLDFGSYGLVYDTPADTAVTVTPAQSCGLYWTILDSVPLATKTVTGEPVPTYWCVIATGTAFTQLIVPEVPAVSFALVDGALPDGLTLDTESGLIAGTPTEGGVFPFSVEVTYPDGSTSVLQFDYLVTDPPVITSGPPPDGSVSAAYSHTVAAVGAPTITYAIVDGALPDGLTLDPATGEISGTPTEAGTFTFSVRATNDYGSDVAAYSVTIGDPPVITSGEPTDGDVGSTYSHTVAADGATPMTFSIIAGALPDGLSLNPATGTISGTPTKDGAYTFTVQAENEFGTDTAEYTIVIGDLPVITSGNPPSGVGGGAYNFVVTAGGADPITYSIVDGTLPPGLTLDPETGVLSGTATRPGTYTFTVRAENEFGFDEATYTVVIEAEATTTTVTASSTASTTSPGVGATSVPPHRARPHHYDAPDVNVAMNPASPIVVGSPPVPASALPAAVSASSPSATVAGTTRDRGARSVAFTGGGSARMLLLAGIMLLAGAGLISAAVRKRSRADR